MNKNKKCLIHFHQHSRRTGVTSSVENILPGLGDFYSVHWYGNKLDTAIPRLNIIGLVHLLRKNNRHDIESIIHVHRNNELIRALLLRLFGVRFYLVATRHSSTPPSWLTRILLLKADKVIVLNQMAKDYFSYPVEIVPHGLNVTAFPINRQVSDSVGIPNKKLIGIVGRVREPKGQMDLVSATVKLMKLFPDWNVVVLGQAKSEDSHYLDSMKDIIQANDLDGSYHFVGEVDDPRPYYNVFQIVVVASYTEGSSMVPLEAMASGCAVVATRDVGTNSMLIDDNVNGYLFEKGDINSLEKKLQNLMEDEDLLNKMQTASRKEIETKWTVETEIQHLRSIYDSLPG